MRGFFRNRVQSRLLRVFVLQLVLISIVTVVTVLAAGVIAKNLLVNRALEGEADFFWANREKAADFPLAASLNLTGYLSDDESNPPPEFVTSLPLGQHKVFMDDENKIVHISSRDDLRLYLFFDDGTVSVLALYFGILPLIFVLVTMYGLAFLAYQLSRRAVSPITRLANTLETFDFERRSANELNLQGISVSRGSETDILVSALDHFVERSQASIDRERNFTRYASHELRTPLAVIQGSASSLELLELDGAPGRAVERIKRTCRQMSDLLNTLLILAREQKDNNTDVITEVNPLAEALLRQYSQLHADKEIQSSLEIAAPLAVAAPDSVLTIVIGNLLDNAFTYTQSGSVTLRLDHQSISVVDTGDGMEQTLLERVFEPFYRVNEDDGSEHQGLGLSIVAKTCKNYGWKLVVDSKVGQGSTFTIYFADAPDQCVDGSFNSAN